MPILEILPDGVGLSESEADVLRAIVRGRRVTSPQTPLMRRFGLEVLVGLGRAGWLESWSRDRAGRPFRSVRWTLTSWGASALGVKIEERENGSRHWAEEWAPEPPFRVSERSGLERWECPELIPDPKSLKGTFYLEDLEGGGWTRDAGRAVRLLLAPVRIDRRHARKRPSGAERRRTRPKHVSRPPCQGADSSAG